MLSNFEQVYTLYPDQSQSITAEYLEDTPKRVKIGEVMNAKGEKQNVYTYAATGEQALEHRVTDEQARTFRAHKGKIEADRISNLPDNVVKRDTGTYVHSVLQEIMTNIIAGGSETVMNKIRFAARDSIYGVSAEDFEMLRNGAQHIYDQIQAIQDQINLQTGTKGEVKIYLEHLVMDAERSIGGTMDIVALFSDNTASIYDYKTMRAHSQDLLLVDGNVQLIKDLVPMYKYEGFTMQLGEYQRILTQKYGVKDIRESRIIPIMVQNTLKEKTGRTEDSRLNNKIGIIQMGSEVSEYLEQIAINEKTGIPGLDKLIKGQINIVERLREQVKTAPASEREGIYKRITTITKGLNQLMIKHDIGSLMVDVYELTQQINSGMKIPRELASGDLNPEYLDIKELLDYKNQLVLYSTMIEDLSTSLETAEEEDAVQFTQKFKTLFDKISYAQNMANRSLGLLDELLCKRTMEIMDEAAKLDNGQLKTQQELDLIDKTVGRHSQVENAIFQKSKELYDQAYYRKDQAVRRVYAEVEEAQKALFKWASDNGMSHKQAFMKLVNMSTGNLHPMLVQKFWDEQKEALESRDHKWMKAHYDIDERSKERYARRLKAYTSKQYRDHNNGQDLVMNGEVVRTGSYYKSIIDNNIANWIKENNLETSNEAWTRESNLYQLRIKKEVLEKYKSQEYRFIENNPALKGYYDMYQKFNDEFRKMMGFNYNELPSNFIPWVRKDSLDILVQGGVKQFGSSIRELMDNLKVREEDIYIKGQDLNTGKMRRHIPIIFHNPILDEDGVKRIDKKSFDLSNVMLQWANVAYNYKYMSEIEDQALGLKEYLSSKYYNEYQTTGKGKKLINRAGGLATKQFGAVSDTLDAFEKINNFHVYGVKYGEGGMLDKTSKKGISTKKTLLNLKGYISLSKLGFGFFPGFAAGAQGHVNAIVEAKKGIAFDMKQWRNVFKLAATDTRRMRGICEFFNIYAEDFTQKRAHKLAGAKATKMFSSRTAFFPIRLADESVDDTILIAMAQNYGLDVDGNLARLMNLPKGTKSVLDMASMDKDGKFQLDLGERGYIQFKNAVREASIRIKGTMNDQDIAQHSLNMAMSMAMQFKTWIPGVLEERFGKLSYNKTLDAVNYGRFRAYMSEYDHIQGASWAEYIGKVVVPNMGKLILDMGTFGISTKLGIKRVNEARAKAHFNRWRMAEENTDKLDTWYRAAFRTWKNLNGNPKISFKEWISSHSGEANKMIYDQFLDMKHRQIKAMVNELRIILALLGVITLMGSKGDDDENPWYYDTWAGRTMNKALSRALSELMFTYNPTEFIRLTSSPFPAFGILGTAMKTLTNTGDEMRDLIFGENSARDITPWGYYSSQWVPGVNQLRKFIEIYAQDKKNPYQLGASRF